MPLYVRDEEVRTLAGRLAARRSCTVAEAVRQALEEALADGEARKVAKRRRAREILDRLDAMPRQEPGFTDRALYDQDGVPIL